MKNLEKEIEQISNSTTPHKLSFFQKLYRFLKALAEFFIALFALIVLTPLFIIVAIAIKIDSKGPEFTDNINVTRQNNLVFNTDTERVIYFAGCMTALTPAIHKSVTTILEKAAVNYVFMDTEGGLCCGRPMLMAGREEPARQMIEKNTELIKASGATTLLLSCPICYRIFKEEYDLEGMEILHHTEYFARLIEEGRLTLDRQETRYVYHDPCELGRGCGVYEQPRKVIATLGELVEAGKNGRESICCGGSLGSLSLGFEKRRTLTENALSNLTVASPDKIVTACPLCRTTFNRYADRPVQDIAEIIASSMK